MTDNAFTIDEKLREIEREIAIRERVYKDWVTVGKMSASRAQKQINILREIARDYRERQNRERPGVCV